MKVISLALSEKQKTVYQSDVNTFHAQNKIPLAQDMELRRWSVTSAPSIIVVDGKSCMPKIQRRGIPVAPELLCTGPR